MDVKAKHPGSTRALSRHVSRKPGGIESPALVEVVFSLRHSQPSAQILPSSARPPHTPPLPGILFTKHVRGCKRMYSYIEDRVLAVADYIIDHQATVRAAAGAFKISKSTVHMVVTK